MPISIQVASPRKPCDTPVSAHLHKTGHLFGLIAKHKLFVVLVHLLGDSRPHRLALRLALRVGLLDDLGGGPGAEFFGAVSKIN